MDALKASLRAAPVVDRNGYEYFVHGVTDGIPIVEPAVMRDVARAIAAHVDPTEFDKIVAPEAMGIHHATAVSLELDRPFVVVRKRGYGFEGERALHQETSYGEGELYLNAIDPGDRVLLVDDVRSSGGTLRAVVDGLLEVGAELVDVVVVVGRTDTDPVELPVPVTTLLEVHVEDGRVVIDD